MKKRLINLLLLTMLVLTSCDDSNVNIISLNTFGNKVCMGDRVKVFVSAETEGDELPSYHWECNGGSLTNPQGLFENVWQAPMEPGEYEIWVTVKCGNSKETRRAKIAVLDELFYSDFETPYFDEGYTNTDVTMKQTSGSVTPAASKSVTLEATDVNAIFQRNWNEPVSAPYSMQMAHMSTSGFKKASDTTINFRIAFSARNGNTDNLRNINFSINPADGKYRVYCEQFDPASGSNNEIEDCVTNGGNDFKYDKKWKYVSVSIDADKKFIVYFDGKKLLESNILVSKFPQNPCIIEGSGLMLSAKSKVQIDEMTVLTNGEICNAAERIR